MLKPLSRLGIVELEIEAKFAGKMWAYTPVTNEHGIALGIAVANEASYYPIPVSWCLGDNWTEMCNHADALNRERKLPVDCAMRIVASTHAAQNRAKKHHAS